DMLQPLGQRLVELALADEAGDQEQRLLDGAVQRRRVAENDLALLEQPLGEQRFGPAEVSVGESVPPLRPGLLLEELLVELDGLLESAETQRLLGLRSGRAGHGCGGKLAQRAWPALRLPDAAGDDPSCRRRPERLLQSAAADPRPHRPLREKLRETVRGREGPDPRARSR